MNTIRFIVFAGLLMGATACGGATADVPASATPTAEEQALTLTDTPAPVPTTTATSVPATDTPAPSATPQPSATSTPTNTVTPTPGPATYRLRPGDTLGSVAANAGVSLEALLSANGLRADDIVKKGLVLQLPEGSIVPELWPAPTPEPLATFTTDVPPQEAPTIYLGRDDLKRVALTFDTGYDPEINAEIAALLAERNVRATFFVVGRGVEQYPEVVADIVRYDHELANHSWSHQDLTEMTPAQVRAEIRDTEQQVQELAPGATTQPFFRAPFGYVDDTVDRIAKEEGFYVVDWTFDSLDWIEDITPDEVRWTVERKLRPGAIVVMHGSSEATLEALPVVLDMLEGNGYEAVTLSELLAPAR